MISWAAGLNRYYSDLKPLQSLPNGIEWLYPQKDENTLSTMRLFLEKFYNDTEERKLILGINPGRFGAGITGVNFTAAKQLTENCGISHPFKNGSEISAEFIYKVIEAYGGSAKFYSDFYLGSVCPLGFIQKGKNINYYDDKELLQKVGPFIIKSLASLLDLRILRQRCICLGGEKNLHHLARWNKEYGWFKEIIPMPHPRFIMQYKRKQVPQYVDLYLEVLQK